MQTEKYSQIVVIAYRLQTIFETNNDSYGANLCLRIRQAAMFLLQTNQDDPEDKIYFKAFKPLSAYSKQCDYRGLHNNIKKLKELLLPDFIRQKQINDNIAYQMYKLYK